MMKLIANFRKSCAVILAASMVFVAGQAAAAPPAVPKDKQITLLNYPLTSNLTMTMSYIDDDLQNTRFTNKGKPVIVTVHHESHHLGTGDYVDVDLPNLTAIYVDVTPLSRANIHKPLITNVSKTFLVKLLPQRNPSVRDTHKSDVPVYADEIRGKVKKIDLTDVKKLEQEKK